MGATAKANDATKDGGSSFAEVYAQEHKAVPQKSAATALARSSQHLAANDKKPAVAEAKKDGKPAVTADGKASPSATADKADKVRKADKNPRADQAQDDSGPADKAVDDSDPVSTKATEKDEPTAGLADAAALPTATTADPTAAAAPLAPLPVDPAQAPQPTLDPAQLQAAAQPQAASANDDFDPAADPLADLPMVRMALEHSAKEQGTTSVHAQADTGTAQAAAGTTTAETFAQGLGAMLEQQKTGDKLGVGGDGDDSLEAVAGATGSAASDGRVDDLGSRLSQLNQAVGGKAPSAATPPAQPLNMQQNGWSEGLVNRVMYLSSQNLKSADIQLHPLELGRLDIRVDVTPDQQTQITFHSAHLGVRDALESQQGRLRDMLSQQGLTQVDVNVSDQSRQSQQQQQQQAQAGQGINGPRGRTGGEADEQPVSTVAEAAATQSVIGSSLVDYYA